MDIPYVLHFFSVKTTTTINCLQDENEKCLEFLWNISNNIHFFTRTTWTCKWHLISDRISSSTLHTFILWVSNYRHKLLTLLDLSRAFRNCSASYWCRTCCIMNEGTCGKKSVNKFNCWNVKSSLFHLLDVLRSNLRGKIQVYANGELIPHETLPKTRSCWVFFSWCGNANANVKVTSLFHGS